MTEDQKKIEELKIENVNLRAATEGKTFFHSDEAVNEEMGRLRSEVERLTKLFEESNQFAIEQATQAEQAESMCHSLADTIESLEDKLDQAEAQVAMLVEALEQIADEEKIYEGHGNYGIVPALDSYDAQALARKTLSSLPDRALKED